MLKSVQNAIRSIQDSRRRLRLADVLISLTRNTESKHRIAVWDDKVEVEISQPFLCSTLLYLKGAVITIG